MKGLVVKKNANLFSVEDSLSGKIVELVAQGKTQNDGIYVGDYVEFSDAILKVCKRKNLLIRPPMANLDNLFIVIAQTPKPDFLLLDKLIVYCFVNNIKPFLVVNKMDKNDDMFVKTIKNIYNNIVDILFVSAKENKLEDLKNEINGISAFAGQSAVGKSSLINSLFNANITQTGDLSWKIARGKQTTRMVQLYKFNNGYIADTAGFSMLSLDIVTNLEAKELSLYYPDFSKAREKCKYRTCLHEKNENCGVIKDVTDNKISKIRYENYLKLLKELKNKRKY